MYFYIAHEKRKKEILLYFHAKKALAFFSDQIRNPLQAVLYDRRDHKGAMFLSIYACAVTTIQATHFEQVPFKDSFACIKSA